MISTKQLFASGVAAMSGVSRWWISTLACSGWAPCASAYDAPLSRSFSAFAGANLAALDAAIWIAAPV